MNAPIKTPPAEQTPWRENGIATEADKASPHWTTVDDIGLAIGNVIFKRICENAAKSDRFEIKNSVAP